MAGQLSLTNKILLKRVITTALSTIEDVAKKAGVSITLVSRYLNGKPGVSSMNCTKIAAALKECDYVRNEVARSLVRFKTNMIGVVSETIVSEFDVPLIRGLSFEANRREYGVALTQVYKFEDAKNRIVNYASNGMFDGIIVYGTILDDMEFISLLSRVKRPIVLVESDIKKLSVNKVIVDNISGIREITDYVITRGCRNLIFLSWGLGRSIEQQRKEGFIQSLKNNGLNFKDEMAIEYPNGYDSGLLNELIKRFMLNLPDAVICGSDQVALKLILTCRKHGLNVPKDLSITGFDGENFQLDDFGLPALTTVRQPLENMGKLAAGMLIEHIEHPEKEPITLIIRPQLIIGGSTI
jgi:LacI family transcriptional regulator